MASSIYIASAEGFTGKSTVALGLLDQLSRVVGRIGVFRPVVRGARDGRDDRDPVLELLLHHDAVSLEYDECTAVTYDDVHADPVAALDRIIQRHHEVAERCDAVVVVGSDYTDIAAPTEFSFNARVAANIGAPVVLVVSGFERSSTEISGFVGMLFDELRAQHALPLAVVANRVSDAGVLEELSARGSTGTEPIPWYAVPDEPLLNAPSVRELMLACQGHLLRGDEQLLSRESTGLVVAAMTIPHVLERLFEGCAVITPGDRPEIVLGVLAAHTSTSFPQVSAIILNGGIPLAPQILTLLDGIEASTPIIATDLGTHATTAALTGLRGRLTEDAPRKIATALALFSEHVDGEALVDRLHLTRSEAVTPLMFEQQLIDAATSDRRHVVLPEGEEERILRAADILLRRGVADLTLLGEPGAIAAKAAS
ncbi:MAG: phosphate acyltransferase, partial [Nocardioides sp.]|nr:phosphate acyltransferase [Nocardioides sp.]